MRSLLRVLLLAASLAAPSLSSAQLFRAYLSISGNDANPCTLPAPCRLLPAALAAVADGGEVWMLDSANYNTAQVVIGKSVTILAVPGAVGSLLSTGGTWAVTVPQAHEVNFRNISFGQIAGDGSFGAAGIFITGAGAAVTVTGCTFQGLNYEGIRIAAAATLRVSDSLFRGNGGWAINAQHGARVSVFKSTIAGPGEGILAYGLGANTTTLVSVTDSLIAGTFFGVNASTTTSTGVARIQVTRTTIDGAVQSALRASTDGSGVASVIVGSSMLVNNNRAWQQSGTGSSILSLGDNLIADTATANLGSLTPAAPQ